MVEQKRGCGWRKIGGAYLCCDPGLQVVCDALPVKLKPCECCGFQVSFVRGIQTFHNGYLASRLLLHNCSESFQCPVCHPDPELGPRQYLMFVSSEYYTPESFIKEAQDLGVSKRIAPGSLPKEFQLGKHWILLAHRKVPFHGNMPAVMTEKGDILRSEPTYKAAIFYAFRPTRIEMVLGDDANAYEINAWEEQGYQVVLVDHKDPKHRGKVKRH